MTADLLPTRPKTSGAIQRQVSQSIQLRSTNKSPDIFSSLLSLIFAITTTLNLGSIFLLCIIHIVITDTKYRTANTRFMSPSVAFIAQDDKQNDLLLLFKKYRPILSHYDIITTNEVDQKIKTQKELTIETVKSCTEGGIIQIASGVVSGEIIGVVLLMDIFTPSSFQTDLQALIRVCNYYDVPIATNMATAELVIQAVAKRTEAYLIFNPVSGQGNPDRELETIRSILEPQMNLHIIVTQPDIDPVIQAKEAIAKIQANENESEDGMGCLIASGGDGTVSAIAGTTIGTGIPFGVIPRGTANAFAVALPIPVLPPVMRTVFPCMLIFFFILTRRGE